MVDEVALVNDDQIDVAQVTRFAANRLDAGKGDGLSEIPTADAGAVDAHRCAWPVQAHLLGVLLDQLLDVREHQDARLWPVLERVLAQGGDDVGLSGAGGQDKTRVAFVAGCKPVVQLLDGAGLVIAQDHASSLQAVTAQRGTCPLPMALSLSTRAATP